MEETLRILVLGDEADRMAIHRASEAAGMSVNLTETSNGAAVITAIQQSCFDCVLLDYHLPTPTQFTQICQICSESKLPFVVLVNAEDDPLVTKLVQIGTFDYLAKSKISPKTLARILRYAVRLHQVELQLNLANQRLQENEKLLVCQSQELEEQRQQIQLQSLQLLEASRLKSQFLATMSHELRTPMNAVIGFSQILLRCSKGSLNLSQRDMVERILNNAKHLLSLINEMLDFSKLETGHLELHLKEFDLVHLVQETVEELSGAAEQKHLALTVKTDVQNPLVTNDRTRLHQILSSLISNGIKFTAAGRVWVEVSEPTPNRLMIAVGDTGTGIAPTNLNRIFEPFRQVDQTITRKYAGTGLGLAIAASLVQLMRGRIMVNSTVGEGSVFRLELPRHVVHQSSAPPTYSGASWDSESSVSFR